MIDIRPTDDFPTLQRLGIAAGLEPVSVADVEVVRMWGAYDGNRMVGGVARERMGELQVVAWLWVAEECRRRGLAARLLDALEADAIQSGIRELWAAARVADVFLSRGYAAMPAGPARDMLLGGCVDCRQFEKTCSPLAVMRALP
jgi:N-acetylglutamate synthase-like GNAT family acetyltransferase